MAGLCALTTPMASSENMAVPKKSGKSVMLPKATLSWTVGMARNT